ncbi:MAG: hypothetical protein KJ006_03495 [Thermoleophilia bacterium]|nr:hypothetical protein [Thermoleophilia bacterium]GIK77371.1 MAG: hypothetical protein BroJett022_10610 [Actinomycetes bacterium]
MAARRLIIVLIALFAISVAAAVIAPDRRGTLLGDRSERASTTTTASPTTSSTERPPGGAAVSGRIDASAARPQSVEARVGDQLGLAVASDRARLVEIPAFGVAADAVPDAPATFNLLLREAGTLPIRDADSGALLGRIEVAAARSGGRR